MASNRPIFIFGCPRSGTTLLSLMLHSHSRIAIPPETRFLMPVYRRRKEFGDLTVLSRENELVKLRDVAKVEAGPEYERSVTRYDRKDAVFIGVVRQSRVFGSVGPTGPSGPSVGLPSRVWLGLPY